MTGTEFDECFKLDEWCFTLLIFFAVNGLFLKCSSYASFMELWGYGIFVRLGVYIFMD
jgi:hypothetical protein